MKTFGDGDFIYEHVAGWGEIPAGWELGQVAPATDSAGRVYLFNRGAHPMIVMDTDGRLIDSWGEGVLTSAHGIYIDSADDIFLGVMYSHTIMKFDREGHHLMTLGIPDEPSNPRFRIDHDKEGAVHAQSWRPSPQMHAAIRSPLDCCFGPFTIPTDVAVAPDGRIFCTDGYGNARVHRFTADGELEHSWGMPGSGEGQFALPHGIWVHRDNRVFVCDRENDRIQIFTSDGDFLDQWTGFKRPCDLFIDDNDNVFIAEGVGGGVGGRPLVAEQGDAFIQIRDIEGKLITRFSGPTDAGAHAIWVDRDGSLYINQNAFGPIQGQLPIVKLARRG